jgi:WD40 repeat protein
MRRNRGSLAGALLVLLPALAAEAAAPPPATRTDLHGDPLPPGAVARLGTFPLRHDGQVHHLGFSPDARRLWSVAAGGVIRAWETASGRRLRQVRSGAGSDLFRFAPDGRTVAAGSRDLRTVLLLDSTTGKTTHRLAGHLDRVTALAFSADGKHLATGSADETVRLWDAARGKPIRTLARSAGEAVDLVFSGDHSLLAAISTRGFVRVWEVATGNLLFQRKAPRMVRDGESVREPFRALAFSPDGKVLLVGTAVEVFICDARCGWCWGRFRRTDSGLIRCLAWSPDGKTVALAGWDVQLWDATRLRPIDTLRADLTAVSALRFSPDSRVLAAGNADGSIQLWDVAARQLLPPRPGHAGSVHTVQFSPDGRTIGTGGSRPTLCLWRADTTRLQARLSRGGPRGEMGAFAFAPDGKTLTTVGANGRITAWAQDVLVPPRRLAEAPEAYGPQLVYTPDGKLLAVCATHTVLLRDARNGKRVRSMVLPGAPRPGWSVQAHRLAPPAFSPRTGWLLAVARGRLLSLIDVSSGGVRRQFTGPGWLVRSVAFSPDEQHVVAGVTYHPETGQTDRAGSAVLAWDVRTGEVSLRLMLEEGLTAVAASPDGQWLAGACGDVRIWELASGKEVLCLRDPEARALSLAFSPDGRRLVSGMTDGTALVWDLEPLSAARPGRILIQERDRLWADLAGADAKQAYQAIWRLAGTPEAARFLGRHLKPITREETARIEQLVKDLDHEEFARRDKANRELQRLGDRAGHVLREALTRPLDLEARRRIERLVARLSGLVVKETELLRCLRAIAVLQRAGTPEAKALLKKLAEGAPGARQTRAAQAALTVLERVKRG